MKKQHRLNIFLIVFVVLVIAGIILVDNLNKVRPANGWYKLGEGNLKAECIDGKYVLHPAPAVYINMLGINGEAGSLFVTNSFEVKDADASKPNLKRISSKLEYINVQDAFSVSVIKSGKWLFGESKNFGGRLSDGRLVMGDNERSGNIFLLDGKGSMEELLDIKSLDEKDGANNIKAASPIVAGNGSSIVFLSSAGWDKSKVSNLSAFMVNPSSKNPKLIIDASKFSSDISYISAGGNTVAAGFKSPGKIAVYDIKTGNVKSINADGTPVCISPDGKSLLIKTGQEAAELSVVSLDNGSLKKVNLQGLVYISGGEWSPDSSKFAFYLCGTGDNDPAKSYKTNVKIGVLDRDKGTVAIYEKPWLSNLYPNGCISWIGNKYITASTDDNISWALKLSK
jgi:Uncharacterized protein related to the periplasmic component of the Tol biopolymer transport system